MRGKMSLILAASALLCVLVGAACDIGFSDDISPPLSVQWAFSLGEDAWNVNCPVVLNDRVYVTHRGVARCLDNVTGAEQWNFSPENAAVTTAPLVWEDIIVVGATNATVYALDAKTGDPVWERICAAGISPDPLLLNDVLLVGAGHMVYALTPASGEASWICSLTSAARVGPVSDGSMAYFLCQDGSIQCVDATQGRYRWTSSILTGPRTFRPIIAGERVVVASGNRIHGVARSGIVAWTADMPAGIGATPVLVDDMLYVPCVDGRLYTLYAGSGAPRHHVVYQVDHSLTSCPVITDTVVAIGSADGLVIVWNADSGQVRWVYRCRNPDQLPNEGTQHGIYAPLVIADGSLYCLTGGGNLYRFSASAIDRGGPVFGDFEPEPGSPNPGGQYLVPACSIVDDGSGVDPTSIAALVDGSPVPVSFDITTGVAILRGSGFPDGSHIVKVSATDYRGNEASAQWSFLTDASILPSPEQRVPGQPGAQQFRQMGF